MNIVSTNYDHKFLKEGFYRSIKDSVNYLREFSDLNPLDDFNLSWDTSAAHYLAIKSAENGDSEKLHFYLDYICDKKIDNGLSILPLFNDNSIKSEMILKIIEDDNQIGFGFCLESDAQLINQETEKIKTAINEIKKYDLDSYNEIFEFIDSIYLTREGCDGERFMRSGTNFYMWGMMFIYIKNTHSIPYYIDHIIHECGHTALNVLNAHDQLVTNAPDELFSAPLRKDKRPMIGLFHALFVLNRICGTFKNILSDKNCSYYDEAKEKYDDSLKKLEETYKTIKENAKTTDLGKEILNKIKERWNLN